MSAASQASLFDPEPFVRKYAKFIAILGALLTFASIYMTFSFGWRWSGLDWAISLSLMSFFACTLPIVIITAYVRQWKAFAYVLTGVWCITVMGDAVTQIGYTAASADSARNNVQLTNMKWEGRKDAVNQHKQNRAIYLNQKEALLKLQPWAATVSADQLRSSLAQLEENIVDEGNAGGCGPKCRKLKIQKQELEVRIGAAEKLQDINKQLKATDVLIAKSKQALDKTDRKVNFGDSQLHHIAAVTSGFSLNPSTDWIKRVEMVMKSTYGFLITFLAAVANGLGLINWQQVDRKRQQEREAMPAHVSDPIAWETGDLPSFISKGNAPGPSVVRFDLFSKHFDNLAARKS